MAPLEESLGSKALLEGDRFFIQMEHPSIKVEADLVAEGYRKLTMLARLIANGSLMAQFIGLKASAEGVTVQQGPSLTQSGDIIALTEDIQQAEQLLDQAMGVLP